MGNEQGSLSNLPPIPADLQASLDETFARFDLNGDGKIERGEIVEKFQNDQKSSVIVSRFFAQMDLNKDGLDREEFDLYFRSQVAIGGDMTEKVKKVLSNLMTRLDKAEGKIARSSTVKRQKSVVTPAQEAVTQEEKQQPAVASAVEEEPPISEAEKMVIREGLIAKRIAELKAELAAELEAEMDKERAALLVRESTSKRDLTIEKLKITKMQQVEYPEMQRSYSCNLSSNLMFGDSMKEEIVRPKVEKIDEEVADLEDEVALLMTSNNRFLMEELEPVLNEFSEEQQGELAECISAIVEVKALDAKLSQAAESLADQFDLND